MFAVLRGQDAHGTATAQALLGGITLYLTKASDNESTEDFRQYSKPSSITKSVDFKVTWEEEKMVDKETRSDSAQSTAMNFGTRAFVNHGHRFL
jgi:hypothetical protein